METAEITQLILLLEQYWWLIALASIWSLVWKGLALWQAARRKELIWFIALLVVNSVGILEIIYLFLMRRKSKKMISEQN